MSEVGSVEYPHNDILPMRTLTLGNGDGTALAGEVVYSAPFYGLLQDNAETGDERALTVMNNMRIKKTTAAITNGDPIHFVANPTGTKNDYWARTAASGETIHGYALETAALNTTDVLIWGPLLPPFTVLDGAAALADVVAALTGATANTLVLADGAGGVKVSAYTVPPADGTANQILKTNGSGAVAWAADAT